MATTTYSSTPISPIDALWALIQGQTQAVRVALTNRLVEQQKNASRNESTVNTDFIKRIKALENDPDGFFKLGGFMSDSRSSAEELLEEALFDKYGRRILYDALYYIEVSTERTTFSR